MGFVTCSRCVNMYKKTLIILAVMLSLLLSGCGARFIKNFHNNYSNANTDVTVENEVAVSGENNLFGPYDLVRVVDGDTILINDGEKEVRVRLIGVDTPESVSTDESRNTEEGKEASEWTKDLLDGKQVYLEYDLDAEDDYERTLAYVYLDDKKTMVNKSLIESGIAKVMTIAPNVKYAKEFSDLETTAKESGTGFWGTGFFSGD